MMSMALLMTRVMVAMREVVEAMVAVLLWWQWQGAALAGVGYPAKG